jgi:hypothetical protein
MAKVFSKTSWIPQIIIKPWRVGYAFLVGYDAALFTIAGLLLLVSAYFRTECMSAVT